MKKILTALLVVLFFNVSAQVTPSSIIRAANSTTAFNETVPAGKNIVDSATGREYLTLLPLVGTKTIATCTSSEIRDLSGLNIVGDNTTNSTLYPLFVSGTGVTYDAKMNSSFTINPYTGALYSTSVSGGRLYAADQIELASTTRINIAGNLGAAGQALLSGGPNAAPYWSTTTGEPALGNPPANGYVLSSTTTGVRSWIANGSGGSMTWPTSAGIAVYSGASSWGTSITDNSSNWNTAYTDRNKWDGGATGLVAATGRTSLGLGGLSTINIAVQTLTGVTPTWNADNGINAKLNLSGNTTITLSNLVAGTSGNVAITNAATVYTLTFSGYTNKISPAIYSAVNRVITSGGSKIDVFSWYYDGTYLFWNGTNGYN